MGLFDSFNPLVLQGTAQGLLQGREAQIAQGNVEAERQVKQQIATTDALRAKNEALAPFRGEIARQLQVHDAYKPYHQANLMGQYGTSDPNDPRVQGDMATWEQTMDPYRQALATDDPDQVRQIIQNGVQKHGSLPPVVAPPSATPAAPATNSTAGAAPYRFGVPFGLGRAVTQSFNPSPTEIIAHGAEVPQDVRAALHLDMPGFETAYNGTARFPVTPPGPPALTPAQIQQLRDAYQSIFGDPTHAGDILPTTFTAPTAPTTDTSETTQPSVPTGPSVMPKSLAPPPASLLPTTPHPSDPALAANLAQMESAYLQSLKQHPLGLLGAAPAPPAPVTPVTTPNPKAPSSAPAPGVPGIAYDSTQPNPAPGPVAGTGPAGSQNPSTAQGAPYLATGPDGTPVLRVPGVGDVPAVTAQRVIDQAKADPAVQAAKAFMTHMNLVASLGPGVDPAVLEKADTAYQTAWTSALDKYGTLDKLPTDQLNTLLTAYSTRVTAETGAQKAPAEIAELTARAAYEREQARVLGPKTEADIQESIARNIGVLHQAGLNDAQAQHDLAAAAHEDAQRQNIPNENRIKFLDADMRGRAELLKANAYWTAYAKSDQGTADLAYIQKNDGIMANAFANLGGNGAPINTLQAWIVIKRAETDPADAVYQRAKAGALQLLQAATASYYGGHPEAVNGPVPEWSAWTGRDLYLQGHKVGEFMNKSDATSKQALDSMRSWTAFYQMMQGGGPGTYAKALDQPGFFARWVNGVQSGWKQWLQNHPYPWHGIGTGPAPLRSFIPPTAPQTVAPNRPNPAPPQPGAPYPPSSTAPSP